MNSLKELAAKILKAAGLTEVGIDDMPSFGVLKLKPPLIVTNLNCHPSPEAKTSLSTPWQVEDWRV